jgi:DNA-binding NtrC family response regulator
MHGPPLKYRLWVLEEEALRAALIGENWNLSHAAKRLGMPFSSLQRTLERHPRIQEELKENGRQPGRPRLAPSSKHCRKKR